MPNRSVDRFNRRQAHALTTTTLAIILLALKRFG
jgi:hypothetical protein